MKRILVINSPRDSVSRRLNIRGSRQLSRPPFVLSHHCPFFISIVPLTRPPRPRVLATLPLPLPSQRSCCSSSNHSTCPQLPSCPCPNSSTRCLAIGAILPHLPRSSRARSIQPRHLACSPYPSRHRFASLVMRRPGSTSRSPSRSNNSNRRGPHRRGSAGGTTLRKISRQGGC